MIEMDISGIKFEAARLHFLSVVVALTPYLTMATSVTGKMTSIRSIFLARYIKANARIR